MEALFRERLVERAPVAGRRWRRVAAGGSRHPSIDSSAPHPTTPRARRRPFRKAFDHDRPDVRYAWRSLAHQKFGSGLVVAMLTLGIGANVAVFALINGNPSSSRFRSPIRSGSCIRTTAPRWNLERTGITYADFVQWQKAQTGVRVDCAFNRRSFNVATDEGADRMDGASVTADFARTLGIEPIIGRMFTI